MYYLININKEEKNYYNRKKNINFFVFFFQNDYFKFNSSSMRFMIYILQNDSELLISILINLLHFSFNKISWLNLYSSSSSLESDEDDAEEIDDA